LPPLSKSVSPSGEIRIRPLEPHDSDAVAAIYAQAIAVGGSTADLQPPGPERWKAFFALHADLRWPAWVREREGQVLGYAFLSPWRHGREGLAGTVEISYYVDQSHRRQGHGRALLRHALQAARSLGYHSALAILLAENRASIALLESEGFARWGTLPGVFRRPGETETWDQCIMGRPL
jgi:phosphinothricin acetyltransferase